MAVQTVPGRTPPRPNRVRWERTPLHAVCAALGTVAGVVAAVYVYRLDWTFPGVLITFGVVSGTVGWLLPDAIVGPHRVARVVFGLLPMAAGVGGFALAALA